VRDANSDALCRDSPPIDPDLAELIEAWPALRESVRKGIMVTARKAAGDRN